MTAEIVPGEKLYPLADAIEKATGYRPSPSTVWRWKLRKGLPFVLVGAIPRTSVEAVHRWNEAATAADRGESPKARTNRQREAGIAKAERALAEAGI